MFTQSTTHPQAINPHAMYRAKECSRLFGVSLSLWWHWCNTGKAMRGIKLGPRVTVWRGDQLLELRQKIIEEHQGGEA